MRLPWMRRTNGESREALRDAEENLARTQARNIEVYEVAGKLKRTRERNHFASDIYTIMRGHPPERDAQ